MPPSRLNDADLARRYIASQDTLDELTTVFEYICSVRDSLSVRKKAAKLRGSGYMWVREFEAMQAAAYVIRLLLERQKGLIQKDRHDLFVRGYEKPEHIKDAANHQ